MIVVMQNLQNIMGKLDMQNKITYSLVKESFEKEGYTLLSDEYVNNHTKLDYICSKSHKHSTTWANWNSGYRCPYCAGQGKPTLKYINDSFVECGYVLLSNKYKNNRTILEYICPKGHKYKTNWSKWNSGKRCPYCAGNVKLDIGTVSASFEDEGYTLLSKIYKGAHVKLNYVCPLGHKHSITWSNWKIGKRCLECSGSAKKTIEYVKNDMFSEKYILLSKEYKNAHFKMKVRCPKGHEYHTSWHNWNHGRRCPICPAKQSKFEKDVRKFLSSSNIKYIHNIKDILVNPKTNKALELDIYFPNINKAIECNGDYWHSKDVVVKRDIIKKDLCNKLGISLLVLSDSEWYSNKNNCKTKIKKFLKLETNIYEE